MQHEFSYEITEQLMRAGARRLMLHAIGWRVPVVLGLYFVVLAILCAIDGNGFFCGLGAGAILLLLLMMFVGWALRHRAIGLVIRRLESRAARCAFGEEGVRIENDLAKSSLKWAIFQKLVRGPDVWLLFMNRQQYFVLPAERLRGEAGEFLAAKVKAAGARVH
jgi:hypothetical protein